MDVFDAIRVLYNGGKVKFERCEYIAELDSKTDSIFVKMIDGSSSTKYTVEDFVNIYYQGQKFSEYIEPVCEGQVYVRKEFEYEVISSSLGYALLNQQTGSLFYSTWTTREKLAKILQKEGFNIKKS